MKKKIAVIMLMVAIMTTCAFTVGCKTDQIYTLDIASAELTATFGVAYTAKSYDVLLNGEKNGEKASCIEVKDPEWKKVTLSFGTFTPNKEGKYTFTYATKDNARKFEIVINFIDNKGPIISITFDDMSKFVVGKDIPLPFVEAQDVSQVDESKSKLFVLTPDNKREQITSKTYIATVKGEYKWIAYAEDKNGNSAEKEYSFNVIDGPKAIKKDVIGYFEEDFGLDQITVYNADATVKSDMTWGNGYIGGATEFTSTVAQNRIPSQVKDFPNGKGIDYVMAFELFTPFITDITTKYDALYLPMYNPNDYSINVRSWFWSCVTIKPHDTIYYSVPIKQFLKGEQAMTNGNYETIFDCTRMVFSVNDRCNSWGQYVSEGGTDEMLPIGAKWVVGDLVGVKSTNVDTASEKIIADYGFKGAPAFALAGSDQSISYSDQPAYIDTAKKINGALIYSPDNKGDNNIAIRTAFGITRKDLATQMSDTDYLSVWVKFAEGSDPAKTNVKAGFRSGAKEVTLTSQWQEIKVWKSYEYNPETNQKTGDGLEHIYLDSKYEDGICIRVSNQTGDSVGVKVAISSIKLIKNNTADPNPLPRPTNVVKDTLVYFNQAYGAGQVSLHNASASLLSDFTWNKGGQKGATRLTSLSSKAWDDNCGMCFSVTSPYFYKTVKDKYEILELPMHNPNAFPIIVYAYFTTWVEIPANGTIYYRMPTSFFESDSYTDVSINKINDVIGMVFAVRKTGDIVAVDAGTKLDVGNLIAINTTPEKIEKDIVVYFNEEVGLRQVNAINATAEYDTTIKSGSEAGSLKLTFLGGESLAVSVLAPYLTDARNYETITVPIYNPNSTALIVRTYWMGDTHIAAKSWGNLTILTSKFTHPDMMDMNGQHIDNIAGFVIDIITEDYVAPPKGTVVNIGALRGVGSCVQGQLKFTDATAVNVIGINSAYGDGSTLTLTKEYNTATYKDSGMQYEAKDEWGWDNHNIAYIAEHSGLNRAYVSKLMGDNGYISIMVFIDNVSPDNTELYIGDPAAKNFASVKKQGEWAELKVYKEKATDDTLIGKDGLGAIYNMSWEESGVMKDVNYLSIKLRVNGKDVDWGAENGGIHPDSDIRGAKIVIGTIKVVAGTI